MRWLIPALPEVAGDLTLRLQLRRGEALLSTAEVNGVRISATSRSSLEGSAYFLEDPPSRVVTSLDVSDAARPA